jgi:site-specific recombinase XerD
VTVYAGEPNEQIIKSFVVAKRVAGASDKTCKYYQFILTQFLNKIGMHFDKVAANDIRIYFAKRELEDGVSDVTRNNERRVLSSFYGWLFDEELISRNPMRKVSKIKTKKVQKKAFTPMDLEQIRAHCQNEKETAVIETLISTGCRVSELAGITLEDIDGDAVIVHGKGDKDRTVYLTAKAQYAIDEYLKSDAYRKRRNKDKVFPPVHTVQEIVRRVGDDAGVSNCHPHRFRRTCATSAMEHGMPIEYVSRMLGHESLETTRIYLDLNDNDMKIAHRKYVN